MTKLFSFVSFFKYIYFFNLYLYVIYIYVFHNKGNPLDMLHSIYVTINIFPYDVHRTRKGVAINGLNRRISNVHHLIYRAEFSPRRVIKHRE